jgi:hypothetical protein
LGKLLLKEISELGIVVHTCNPSTKKAEAGESQVPSQPQLHRKILSWEEFN